MKIESNIIDIENRSIYAAEIEIDNGIIISINRIEKKVSNYMLPGFVDAHIHIESSMLTPYQFARKALIHGTVATVSDPHEIANVCGLSGVYYMLENARDAKLKFHFGAPSCVPATAFETAGAALEPQQVKELLQNPEIYFLSEMMNYPGVLFSDEAVMQKINLALQYGKPIDGHAPGLKNNDAKKYIEAGRPGEVTISTDHECFTIEEALDKLKFGMKIIIREGSAAKNFEALHSLITTHTNQVMFCSDDKHPDDLMQGHINEIVKRALRKGHNLFDVLQCACLNPVSHYKLRSGTLKPGHPADFIIVNNTTDFNVFQTYIDGICMAENGTCILPDKPVAVINNFSTEKKLPNDFEITTDDSVATVDVIEALDGQLITNHVHATLRVENNRIQNSVEQDVLKITVVSRYNNNTPAKAFIKNFGLKTGAIASTVAHDSHNIICVGTDDESICRAVNLLIDCRGGLSVVNGANEKVLPLEIAGLMSPINCDEVGNRYSELDKMVKEMGCKLRSPFMTLSFMALLVIPDLKLSDKGLFSGKIFSFI